MFRVIEGRFLFIVLFCLGCGARAFADDGQRLLQILRDADAEFFSAVTLSIVVTGPVGFGPERGNMTWQGTLTAFDDYRGIILEGVRFDPPAYRPPRTGNYQDVDYDADGNMIVGRLQDGFGLQTENSNDAYEKWAAARIAPNGALTEGTGFARLCRYQVSDQKSLAVYKYNAFVPATGRGFAQYITTISQVKTLPSGLIDLQGTGPRGALTLTVDPTANYLVRTAVFGSKEKEVISTTDTQVQDGLTIPLRGTITSPPGSAHERVIMVEFKGVSKTGHEEVIKRLKARLSEDNLPVGTLIEDYRADPTSPFPVRTTVGEE
ncbi:MAG: hypothetical protein V2A79_01660 [Planctomycetota bacterium]